MVILRRALAIILIFVLVLPLAGCWNRRELNTLGIVGMVGVDTGNNGIKSTFEIIKPEKRDKGSEKPGKPVKFLQSDSSSIIDSLRDASLRFDRKLFFSHTKGFLFSEEIARNGLAEHLDVILRHHEMRLSMHLAIVKDASASDVMNIASGINTIPSMYIEDIFKQYKVPSKSVDSKVLDFLKAYLGKGKNPVVTVLKKVKKTKIETEESEEYELHAEGSAVFLKDRLVGFMDGEETRGYNWVIGKVIGGVVTFPTPDSNGTTAVEILQAGSKNEVEITGNDIIIKVKINMNGVLDEQTTNVGQYSASAMEKLEQATAQAIKREVEHTLRKVQAEYKSDIFGFGQLVHRKYPREWKNMQDDWDELFSQATIEVEVQTKITKTGKSSYSVKD